MILEERIGDLFESPPSLPLAHCVSADLQMSSGIALVFRSKYNCVSLLRMQHPHVGGVVCLYAQGRHIFYMVTKRYKIWLFILFLIPFP